MSTEDQKDAARTDPSALGRLYGAVELIASAHASRARDEAGRDLSRIGSGATLLLVAALFFVPALLLLNAAAVLWIHAGGLALHISLLAVAGANAVIALAALMAGRSRLALPVLVETRATLKRAALVVRGA